VGDAIGGSATQSEGKRGNGGIFLLLVTLGVVSLRKGHWVMFIVGLFIPLFWIIGAIMPRRMARM
jgi:hypothetical protein